ncbi:hypothetical protein V8C42DRAFT_326326 [Trichoderma barbatum]
MDSIGICVSWVMLGWMTPLRLMFLCASVSTYMMLFDVALVLPNALYLTTVLYGYPRGATYSTAPYRRY